MNKHKIVICIEAMDGHLTRGRWYDVLEENPSWYLLRNDNGINYWFMKKRFRDRIQDEAVAKTENNKQEKFYLFAGDDRYSRQGGAADFKHAFDTVDAAIRWLIIHGKFEWWQVTDSNMVIKHTSDY